MILRGIRSTKSLVIFLIVEKKNMEKKEFFAKPSFWGNQFSMA